MGIPYLPTLIYKYAVRRIFSTTPVNLADESVIIDGNAAMYFIYDKVVADDKTRAKKDQLTKTPFAHDGYREMIRELFLPMREKCESVTFVFDGVYERHPRRRQDPERTISTCSASPNGCRNRLPLLFKHQLENVLKELGVELIVARGEADPMIVALAKERNAYVISDDSDYLLYEFNRGYVPLRSLNFKELRGPRYRMENVFRDMDARAVALWASLIGYDFVSFEDLQVRLICFCILCWFLIFNMFQRLFVNFHPYDEQDFLFWLEKIEPDKQADLWLRNEYYLLRFIQVNGSRAAETKLMQLIPPDQRVEFEQLRSTYINVQPVQTIQTRGNSELPSFVDRFFISGDLGHVIINIFINRKLLLFTESDNDAYFQFLSPIMQLILKWDRPADATENSSTVLFNGKQCNPFKSINEDELPSAGVMDKMSKKEKKKWLLSCVQSALGSHMIVGANSIHNDQLVWICLLKIWYRKTEEPSSTKDTVLRAMIVAYLNRKLLAATAPPGKSFFHWVWVSGSSVNFIFRMFFVDDNNSISIGERGRRTVEKECVIQTKQRYQQSHKEKCICCT